MYVRLIKNNLPSITLGEQAWKGGNSTKIYKIPNMYYVKL